MILGTFKLCLFAVVVFLLAVHTTASRAHGELLAVATVEQSLCQSEYLRVKCDADEVVMVTHARYGRMRISRCVKENFGYVGCSIDVLPVLDLHCSGRRTCSVRVLDDNFDNVKPCHDDLKSYLEVKYTCVRVIAPERQYCQSLKPVVVTNQTGYLASITSTETGCGTADAPWLVQLLPGQRVNITLYDFATASPPSISLGGATAPAATDVQPTLDASNSTFGGGGGGTIGSDTFNDKSAPSLGSVVIEHASDLHPSRMCRVYAIVRELASSRTATICGGETRYRISYVSLGHSVEIRVIGGSISGTALTSSVAGGPGKIMMQQVSFLLKYEAIGCPEVDAPSGGWIKKSARLEMTIGCTDRPETWKLRCQGSEWVGERRNCSVRAERIEAATEDFVSNLSIPLGFSLVIIVALALLIGLLILSVGVICLKRLKQQDEFEIDQVDAADLACFALADGVGNNGRFVNGVRTLCPRSVNCTSSSRLKMTSPSSAESRDVSPYEPATSSLFQSDLHACFRSIATGNGCPMSLSGPGGPTAAGYASMTLLTHERECSPEPDVQSVGAISGNVSCRCGGNANQAKRCCGTGHYGCRLIGSDRAPMSDQMYPVSTANNRQTHAPSGEFNAPVGKAVVYACAKHRNVASGDSDDANTSSSLTYQGQAQQQGPRRCKEHENENNGAKMSPFELGDVF